MDSIEIPCGECGAKLRLRDRSMLGKKGKCPACGHRFLLEEETVELELAEPSSVSIQPTAVGTNARWVPDAAAAEPPAGDGPPSEQPPEFQLMDIASQPTGGVARLQELRRKNKGRRKAGIIATFVVIGAVGAAWLAREVLVAESEKPQEEKRVVQKDKKSAAPKEEPAATATSDPIDLNYVAHGTGILINLRPAELWESGSKGDEVRACLGSELSSWLDEKMKAFCLFEPTEIEEVKFCVVYGLRGEPIELSGVVTLTEAKKPSELHEKFSGSPMNDMGRSYYRGETTSYSIIDPRTFAFIPNTRLEDWKRTRQNSAITSDGITELLKQTDRKRQVTIVFEPSDVRIHSETLFPESAQPAIGQMLDWFGDDVETAVWSFQLGKRFDSEIKIRNRSTIRMSQLEQQITERLEETPARILAAVRQMNPQQLGPKRIMSRFPAMTLAFQRGTDIVRHSRFLQLKTVLNERATPNLFLGTMLTWDESTRTDFSGGPARPTAEPVRKLPATIAGRLAMKIDVDFRKEAMRQALDQIFAEIQVKYTIDLAALEEASVTQNLPQTLELLQTSASSVLDRILTKIKLVIIVDEEGKQAKLTSAVAAERAGEKPFPLGSGNNGATERD